MTNNHHTASGGVKKPSSRRTAAASASSRDASASSRAALVSVAQEDHLDTDPVLRGQRFACVSFVSPEDVIMRKDVYLFDRFVSGLRSDLNTVLSNLETFFAPDLEGAKEQEPEGSTKAEAEAEAEADAKVEESEGRKEAAEEAEEGATLLLEQAKQAQHALAMRRLHMATYVKDSVRMVRERYAYLLSDAEAMQEEFRLFTSQQADALDADFRAAHSFQTSVRGFKIRGVFDTLDDARARCKAIERFDSRFHVYVAEVGCWCPWSPNPDDVGDVEYAETNLNTLMKGFKESQAARDQLYNERKSGMATNIAEDRDAWLAARLKAAAVPAANADVAPPSPKCGAPVMETTIEEGEEGDDEGNTEGKVAVPVAPDTTTGEQAPSSSSLVPEASSPATLDAAA